MAETVEEIGRVNKTDVGVYHDDVDVAGILSPLSPRRMLILKPVARLHGADGQRAS